MLREIIVETASFKGWAILSQFKLITANVTNMPPGNYYMTRDQQNRSEQHGRREVSVVFMWNCECNQMTLILGYCSISQEETHRYRLGTRSVVALLHGKSITLVKLLRAKYCADSCDTRWTKPLPAACPSQRWWAFSLSLASSASRLVTSSSTHWASIKQVEDECGGVDDKATGSKWANDWKKMLERPCESVARNGKMR